MAVMMPSAWSAISPGMGYERDRNIFAPTGTRWRRCSRRRQNAGLLVMGGYGHSRLRNGYLVVYPARSGKYTAAGAARSLKRKQATDFQP